MSEEVAVVVGVGPGLGWALVERFTGAGMRVAMAARSGERLQALLPDEPAGEVAPFVCDATDPAAVEQLFASVDELWGTPDVVVFNAGAYAPGGILEIDAADFERCWRVGCFAGFLVSQAAARRMVPRARGSILITGATASLRGSAGFANLASPKFALRALAQSMARELGPQGIHVAHVIVDGMIAASRHGPNDQSAYLEPAAIADSYLHLHRQDRSAWTLELDVRPWVEKF